MKTKFTVIFLTLLVSLFFLCFSVCAQTMLPPPKGYTVNQKIFEDQFSSSKLDAAKWNGCMGGDGSGCWQGSLPSPYSTTDTKATVDVSYDDPYPAGYGTDNGAGNHLVISNGVLKEIATPDNHFKNLGYTWASAAITTFGKAYVPAKGGYLQIHARLPEMRWGGWGALWLMPDIGTDGHEFDIIDGGGGIGTNGDSLANRTIFSNWFGTKESYTADAGTNLTTSYHTWGWEYIPGTSFKVYLDGKLCHTWTNGVSKTAKYEVIISMQIAGSDVAGWHTLPDVNTHPGPFELDVDDVQIYSLSTSTSVGENSPVQNPVSVFPNPCNANFRVSISSATELKNAMFKMYDLCGREVRSVLITSHETSIDTDELQSGLYFYSITNNNDKVTDGKLIIQ